MIIENFSDNEYNAIVAYHFHCVRFSVNLNSRSEDSGFLVYDSRFSFFIF